MLGYTLKAGQVMNIGNTALIIAIEIRATARDCPYGKLYRRGRVHPCPSIR